MHSRSLSTLSATITNMTKKWSDAVLVRHWIRATLTKDHLALMHSTLELLLVNHTLNALGCSGEIKHDQHILLRLNISHQKDKDKIQIKTFSRHKSIWLWFADWAHRGSCIQRKAIQVASDCSSYSPRRGALGHPCKLSLGPAPYGWAGTPTWTGQGMDKPAVKGTQIMMQQKTISSTKSTRSRQRVSRYYLQWPQLIRCEIFIIHARDPDKNMGMMITDESNA